MTKPVSNFVQRSAGFRAESLNREARTVEAIASTGADVRRIGFVERLNVAGANLEHMTGAPVLNAHRQGSVSDALGVVEEARIEGGRIIVRMKFSRRADAETGDCSKSGGFALVACEKRLDRGLYGVVSLSAW